MSQEEELAEWREAIDQVIYHTEIDRNEFPLDTRPTIIHGLNPAVRVNNAEANTLMGMCHLKLKHSPSLGEFFEASAEKGIQLLERAKQKDFPPAIYQLSECYRCTDASRDSPAHATHPPLCRAWLGNNWSCASQARHWGTP
jgi:hypothetical protein